MEYNSALKRNEVLLFAIQWMDHENVIPSERRQKKRTNSIWFNLPEISRAGKFVKLESTLKSTKG
jgi:hypothetical protein